jgi:hypothetical protein
MVLSCDNSVPHLLSDEEILHALRDRKRSMLCLRISRRTSKGWRSSIRVLWSFFAWRRW